MSNKKQSRGGLAGGVALIIIALGLVAVIFMELCGACTGWNAINPLCYMGQFSCLGVEWIAKLVMGMGAFILFFAGIWKIVRS